jgi:hypothetical protein
MRRGASKLCSEAQLRSEVQVVSGADGAEGRGTAGRIGVGGAEGRGTTWTMFVPAAASDGGT